MNSGILLVVSAYIFWGLHPIYWKLLRNVPSSEIVSHRIVWSLIFFSIVVSSRKGWKGLRNKFSASENKLMLIIPALLIGSNWAMYIWAVNAGFIIETSLGYFICPLVSVFLGVFVLNEELRKAQWISVVIAGIGVLMMTVIYGQLPWISIYLASTWGLYGLLRKKSPLNAVEGLTLETAVLLIPAIILLTNLEVNGTTSFLSDLPTSILLVGTGIISGLPLIIFISGARMIDLSIVGILQFIYPILIFLIGVFIYNESLSEAKIIGLIIIWIALIVYILDSFKIFNNKIE